jgi:hypothetical protein
MGGECSTTGAGKNCTLGRIHLKDNEYLEYVRADGGILQRISDELGWRIWKILID